MSALLLFPALTPFVLLAIVMRMSWLEDRILPPPEPNPHAGVTGRALGTPPPARRRR